MNKIHGLFFPAVVVAFAVLFSVVTGAEPMAPTGQFTQGLNVAVVGAQQGANALEVTAPWRKLANPTVRVVLMTGEAADISKAEPVLFQEGFDIKLIESMAAGTSSFGEAVGLPSTIEVPTKNGGNFELISSKNSLGKQASMVVGLLHKFGDAAACAFIVLTQWSKGETETLVLDLPESHFAKPGALRVWLFDGETLLDSKTLDWPGARRV